MFGLVPNLRLGVISQTRPDFGHFGGGFLGQSSTMGRSLPLARRRAMTRPHPKIGRTAERTCFFEKNRVFPNQNVGTSSPTSHKMYIFAVAPNKPVIRPPNKWFWPPCCDVMHSCAKRHHMWTSTLHKDLAVLVFCHLEIS